MVKIGNFFFKYRNWVFILFYAALFIPSWRLFSPENAGTTYYLFPIIIGLFITITGQLIRGLTIGLAYIVRGGKEGKPYAEGLVTEGIFNHCRNPLVAFVCREDAGSEVFRPFDQKPMSGDRPNGGLESIDQRRLRHRRILEQWNSKIATAAGRIRLGA